jgi:hypothetical protein
VLEWQAEAHWEQRAKMSALILTAGCAWLLNGLHSAPDNKLASRHLMDCILPLVDRRGGDDMFFAYGKAIDDNDGDDDRDYDGRLTLPASPYGLTFFRDLRLGPNYPVPRFKSGIRLSPRAFYFFFNIEFEDIRETFFRSGGVAGSQATLRSRNKVQRTRRYIPEDNASPATLFHLRVRGVALQAPAREAGSDQEEEGEEEELDKEEEDGTNIDEHLTKLWRQFIVDVTEKVPNRKRADENGYCCLTPQQRQTATDGLYQNLCLSEFFNDCQWRVGSEAEWDVLFNHVFPLEEKRGKVQNYRSMLYYSMWQKIKDRSPDRHTLIAIRRALKSKFDTLLWFPNAQADRIWPTAPSISRYKKFVDRGSPAPWVLCRRRPFWREGSV